ncbi:MAG: hypothetical protein JNL94_16625 [Planctomycetes bacterium]|nr:hypothetical protein [Planctomycetota bacterium]
MVHQLRRSVVVLALLASGFIGCSSDQKAAEADAAQPQAATSVTTSEAEGCCGMSAAKSGCGDACVGETGGGCCAESSETPKN